MTKTDIPPSLALERFGISTEHTEMPNGEKRFRLTDQRGLGYVMTVAGSEGGWQNSHYHKLLIETYIVQEEWLGVATLADDGELLLQRLSVGEVWSAGLGIAHNIYMPCGSISHVVKHGKKGVGDWHTNSLTEKLDRLTKSSIGEDVFSPSKR
jgi:hypothetical protein